jgi:hypothetical protein
LGRLLLVLIQEVFLAVLELDWDLFLSAVWVLQGFLQEFDFLLKKCFLFIELRFGCDLHSLDLLLIIFSRVAFLSEFLNLSLELSLLGGDPAIEFGFELILLTLDLLQMLPSALLLGRILSFFDLWSSELALYHFKPFLQISLVLFKLLLELLDILVREGFNQV